MRPQYTVTLGYDPTGQGWTGGLVEDVPRTIAEHAVYRKLKEKAEQHRGVPGPYVVRLGSDRSPALSRAGRQSGISRDDAVNAVETLTDSEVESLIKLVPTIGDVVAPIYQSLTSAPTADVHVEDTDQMRYCIGKRVWSSGPGLAEWASSVARSSREAKADSKPSS